MIETQDTLLQLQHRPVELGRIRTGIKATSKSGKEYPAKLDTFRLTSGSQALLDAAASLYGGTVEEWKDAPDEGYWQLITESRELRVLIPRDLRTVSQAYEWWQGGTCERRCDGTVEQISDGPCLCDDSDRLCDPVTRISLMLPDVPGLGVWRLDSGGWHAATSLPATISLLKQLSTASWIPAILRLEQRSKKAREADGKVVTHRFAVPVLDLPNLTIGKVVAAQNGAPVPRIDSGTPAATPTASERVAERRAAIEANESGPVDGSGRAGVGETTADPPRQADEPPWPAQASRRRTTTGDGNPPVVTEAAGIAPSGTAPANDEVATGQPSAGPANASPAAPRGDNAATRCTGFDGALGRCVREPHELPPEGSLHKNAAGETWA